MRIIGDIPHPRYKITLLSYQERLTLQIENGDFAQHYRVRMYPGMETAQDLKTLVTEDFLAEVTRIFAQMAELWQGALPTPETDGGVWEEIL
jgi:hypothetical protein